MAFQLGLPVLILREKGVITEGIFGERYFGCIYAGVRFTWKFR